MSVLLDAGADASAVDELESVEKRDVRAMCELLAVYEEETDLFLVYSDDGTEYTVDAESGACTCPDAEYNLGPDEKCKHARRVDLWTGRETLPEWVSLDAVDPLLVDHLGLGDSEGDD
jgi:hypothetical protein